MSQFDYDSLFEDNTEADEYEVDRDVFERYMEDNAGSTFEEMMEDELDDLNMLDEVYTKHVSSTGKVTRRRDRKTRSRRANRTTGRSKQSRKRSARKAARTRKRNPGTQRRALRKRRRALRKRAQRGL